MKKLLVLSSLVLAVVSTTFAAESTSVSENVLMPFGDNQHARLGMSRVQLIDQLGEPSEKLSATVWAYWDFRAIGRPAGERGDALIVVFTRERVSLLRFTERSAVAAALAKVRTTPGQPAVIAKQ